MKTKSLLFGLLLISSLTFGQTFLMESFDGGQMPPTG